MTMPHLMNCRHSDVGWCLTCVKDEHDANESIIKDLMVQCEGLKEENGAYDTRIEELEEQVVELRRAILEASRITFEHVYEEADVLMHAQNDDPDKIQVKPSDMEQFLLASRLIGDACKKWLI